MKKRTIQKFYSISLTVLLILFLFATIWQIEIGNIASIMQFVFVFAMTLLAFGNLFSFLTSFRYHKSEYQRKDWLYVSLYILINIFFVIGSSYILLVLYLVS
jgi:hypothetical protein